MERCNGDVFTVLIRLLPKVTERTHGGIVLRRAEKHPDGHKLRAFRRKWAVHAADNAALIRPAGLSLRGAQRRGNPETVDMARILDCFASLAMTNLNKSA
jgi:hypothetical protein